MNSAYKLFSKHWRLLAEVGEGRCATYLLFVFLYEGGAALFFGFPLFYTVLGRLSFPYYHFVWNVLERFQTVHYLFPDFSCR